jgi:hypothetical protein
LCAGHYGKVKLANICGSIDILLIRNEINSEAAELLDSGNEFNGRSGKAVIVENEHHIDFAFAHELNKRFVARPFRMFARSIIDIFPDNLKTSMSGIFPKLPQLRFGVLPRFVSGDTGIDGGTLRFASHVVPALSGRHDEQIQKILSWKSISIIFIQ